MIAIRTEGLRKSYGTVQALDGLDLSVDQGAVFGFLGPNGAGKTTTLRILAGLARATSGRAWVGELEAGIGRQAVARRIGFLPEEPAFYPWMTPREFLDHVGRTFKLPARERDLRTRELLALAGLTEVSKRRIGGFSRGMRQRLGLAQALVNRPEVLLLDEPVSALDPAGRKEVLDLIEQLSGTCTVFMSTHILADVERVCDTVGIVNRGKLVVEARREELIARYAVPAFEIEAEPRFAEQLKTWADDLTHYPWVTGVATNGGATRVLVSDVETAGQALLGSVAALGVPVTRYEMVRPSLEDVFLRLVADQPGQGGPVV